MIENYSDNSDAPDDESQPALTVDEANAMLTALIKGAVGGPLAQMLRTAAVLATAYGLGPPFTMYLQFLIFAHSSPVDRDQIITATGQAVGRMTKPFLEQVADLDRILPTMPRHVFTDAVNWLLPLILERQETAQ